MGKINRLLQDWPKGTIYTSAYLKSLGFSDALIYQYKQSNWIESLGRGAFKQKEDEVDWLGGIYTLQTQNHSDIHPAGKSALQLLGKTHYLPFRFHNIYMYSSQEDRLPAWFFKLQDADKCIFRPTNLFSNFLESYFVNYQHKSFSIKIASSELASFEMLHNIPQNQSFDEAYKIFENLTTLRADLVQLLLESCNSIKVKRLFLYFAEEFEQHWFKKLKLKNIYLGHGKRVIDKNGKLNKKYLITVPELDRNDEIPVF
ncbi:MAG: type IV toxin-antitoxin system AbiEi family antitoxin [Candidatus Cloacimonetes bacterium]|nr:type IV toxin-antitoxin system AbiEi family antitoxin [Candidatus Cloacimonadota bacterium]MCF7813202.1 type IV toxin-antitoxin system AbiEi family antitoxin [Candidatus Cloacimonadota bacterium]MCF7867401.1 type IV toxin-antitoxin system AbiEi family antitoxin [Candidatus Cloacimonadota bacterium]MCF7882967.1 type IV toxin-antitoxin system AbiEi family antitoxin [Candidatus Cloacimonadota bacterium]